jgi:hypothetical protein
MQTTICNIIMADIIDLSESDIPSISPITPSVSSSVPSVSHSNDRVTPSVALTPDRDVHCPAPLTKLSHTTIARVLILAGSRIRSIIQAFQKEFSGSGRMGGDRLQFYRNGLQWEIEVSIENFLKSWAVPEQPCRASCNRCFSTQRRRTLSSSARSR